MMGVPQNEHSEGQTTANVKKCPAGTLFICHVLYLGDFRFCVRHALNHIDACAYQQLSNMRNTSEWSLDRQLGMGCV